MSLDDPYFDDWVREKINQLEAKTPDHLWDAIRDSSRFYIIVDRNKYLLALFLLLATTGTVGYWAFHPTVSSSDHIASTSALKSSRPVGSHAQNLRGQDLRVQSPLSQDLRAHNKPSAGPQNQDAFSLIALGHQSLANRQPVAPANETFAPIDGAETRNDASIAQPKGLAQTAEPGAPATEMTYSLTLRDLDQPSIKLSKPAVGKGIIASNGLSIPASISSGSKRKIYWEAFAGPDHVTHYIKATTSQYEGYVRQVRATESGYPSFSMGLKADIPVLGNRWRMQVGLRFSQINEELNYTNVQGNTVTSKYSFNTYRGLDLPVLTSYSLVQSRQLEFKVSGGALFNLASWFRGDVLDTNYRPMALHVSDTRGTPQSTVWKNSIGTSLYSSVTLYDQVFPKVQVGIEPYIRYELSPVNNAVSVYTERFLTTGLMFNIRFQLGQ